ncbi:aminoglycoside phosphotransferase family protein [Leifsonia sp. ZF2019]|uniref:aminoglycoside phosphotransferase family protein n=1 Tax=Leifsonia sp. ZF2019 TaxID=2781978 RepID=UPI001CBB5E16|nr:aminoglycoside phosphotransferase family protein [Leifsonia sp. ZF2019]
MSARTEKRTDPEEVLAPWRARWSLIADGDPFVTPSSALQPVRRNGRAAFLKRALVDAESAGARVQRWWGGDGAADVLAFGGDGDALLLERAEGSRSLAALARSGPDGDDDATRILCRAGLRLHEAGRDPRPDGLIPLAEWFRELFVHAEDRPDDHHGLFPTAAATAAQLLALPAEDVVLHGDLHHGNVLDFGERGWLAIDPKPVHGAPLFDWVNILCNPDVDVALRAGRLERTAAVISAEVATDEGLLMRWALAWAGLSAAWSERSGEEAEVALAVGRRARVLLGG